MTPEWEITQTSAAFLSFLSNRRRVKHKLVDMLSRHSNSHLRSFFQLSFSLFFECILFSVTYIFLYVHISVCKKYFPAFLWNSTPPDPLDFTEHVSSVSHLRHRRHRFYVQFCFVYLMFSLGEWVYVAHKLKGMIRSDSWLTQSAWM